MHTYQYRRKYPILILSIQFKTMTKTLPICTNQPVKVLIDEINLWNRLRKKIFLDFTKFIFNVRKRKKLSCKCY